MTFTQAHFEKLTRQDRELAKFVLTNTGEVAVRVKGTGGSGPAGVQSVTGNIVDVSDPENPVVTQINADRDEADTTSPAFIENKPTIPVVPTDLSAFNNDVGFITDISGQDLSIADNSVSQFITAGDIPTQVQSDWDQTDNTQVDYINNKPTIPTVPTDIVTDDGLGVQPQIPYYSAPGVLTSDAGFKRDLAGKLTTMYAFDDPTGLLENSYNMIGDYLMQNFLYGFKDFGGGLQINSVLINSVYDKFSGDIYSQYALSKAVSDAVDNHFGIFLNREHDFELSRTLTSGMTFGKEGLPQIQIINNDVRLRPQADGNSGDTLVTDGAGNLSFQPSSSVIIDITYDDLMTEISNSTLKIGTYYKIIDFQTKHQIPNTPFSVIHTAPVEAIMVLAINTNEVSSRAYSETHPEDIIYYDHTMNLCEDSVTFRPGHITFRRDTKNDNETYYDFRGYKFRRYAIDSSHDWAGTTYYAGDVVRFNDNLYYCISLGGTNPLNDPEGEIADWIRITLDLSSNETIFSSYFTIGGNTLSLDYSDFNDYSTFEGLARGIKIGINSFDNVFFGDAENNTLGSNCSANTFVTDPSMGMNLSANYTKIGNNSMDNMFIGVTFYNEIGSNCYGNVFCEFADGNKAGNNLGNSIFGDGANNNKIGNSCGELYFQLDTGYNTIGDNTTFILFKEQAYFNEVGYQCYGNIFAEYCYYNKIGNDAYYNVLGTFCVTNTLGDFSENNQLWDASSYNELGNQCRDNIIQYACEYNIFGDFSSNNNIESYSFANKFGIYCEYNNLGTNCGFNTFAESCSYNDLYSGCVSNTLGILSGSNILGDGCLSNTIGDNTNNTRLGNNCISNIVGDNCFSNDFLDDCIGNQVGDQCESNSFANNCSYNIIGNQSNSNIFYAMCSYNKTGNMFDNNSLGDDCSSNTFGDFCFQNELYPNCKDNVFGNKCNQNILEDNCERNIIGIESASNHFGSACAMNVLGVSCQSITLGESCNNNIFGDLSGSSNLDIGSEFNNFSSVTNMTLFTATKSVNFEVGEYDLTGFDFTSATLFPADHNKTVFKNANGDIRLRYFDATDNLVVDDINA